MTHRVICIGMIIGALALTTSCAPHPARAEDVPASSAGIAALLAGRWYQADLVMPGAIESYRFELTFAADGSCAYYFIPADRTRPARVTRGAWRLDGRMLLFAWGAHTFPSHPLVESGRISEVDRRHLMIDRGPHGFQSFYRRYRDSISRLQKA